MKRLLLTALTGAGVAFIWGMFSWMALPWHHQDFIGFTDETPVSQVLKDNSSGPGIYFLPYMAKEDHGNAEKEEQWAKKAGAGPFGFLVLVPGGITHNMGASMANQFLLVFVVALLLARIIGTTHVTSPHRRALLTMAAALSGAIMAHGSHWNWWHFPDFYTAVNIADIGIQWLLAGFVMAKVADKIKI